MAGNPRAKYPMATIAPYGPDDKTVTKLAVAIFQSPQDTDSIALNRWVAADIAASDPIARRMYQFLKAYGVKTVLTATVVVGCPHEEGADFPVGQDCPFCPFWKGKQGSGSSDSRWDPLKEVRVEKLGFQYRFWLP